jgi:hypothetical protein
MYMMGAYQYKREPLKPGERTHVNEPTSCINSRDLKMGWIGRELLAAGNERIGV